MSEHPEKRDYQLPFFGRPFDKKAPKRTFIIDFGTGPKSSFVLPDEALRLSHLLSMCPSKIKLFLPTAETTLSTFIRCLLTFPVEIQHPTAPQALSPLELSPDAFVRALWEDICLYQRERCVIASAKYDIAQQWSRLIADRAEGHRCMFAKCEVHDTATRCLEGREATLLAREQHGCLFDFHGCRMHGDDSFFTANTFGLAHDVRDAVYQQHLRFTRCLKQEGSDAVDAVECVDACPLTPTPTPTPTPMPAAVECADITVDAQGFLKKPAPLAPVADAPVADSPASVAVDVPLTRNPDVRDGVPIYFVLEGTPLGSLARNLGETSLARLALYLLEMPPRGVVVAGSTWIGTTASAVADYIRTAKAPIYYVRYVDHKRCAGETRHLVLDLHAIAALLAPSITIEYTALDTHAAKCKLERYVWPRNTVEIANHFAGGVPFIGADADALLFFKESAASGVEVIVNLQRQPGIPRVNLVDCGALYAAVVAKKDGK